MLDDIITSRDGDAPPFAWQHILHLSKGVPNPVLDHTLVAYRTSLGRLRSGSVKVFVPKGSLDNGEIDISPALVALKTHDKSNSSFGYVFAFVRERTRGTLRFESAT